MDNTSTHLNTMYDVIVIGGGIAGLIAAREFGKSNIKVLLLEAQSRLGGRIASINEDNRSLCLGGEWIDYTHVLIQEELRRYNIPIRTEELDHCWAFPHAHSVKVGSCPVNEELEPMLEYIFQQIDIDASRLYNLSGLDSSAISSFDIPWTEYVAHHLQFSETPEVKKRMAASDLIHQRVHQHKIPMGKGGGYGHHHLHSVTYSEDVYQPIRDFLQAQTFAVIKGDLNQVSALHILHYIYVHGGTQKVFLEQKRFHFDASLLIQEIYKEIQEDLRHVVTIQTNSPILTMSAYEFDPYTCEYNSDRREGLVFPGSSGVDVDATAAIPPYANVPYYMTVRDTNHRNYIGKKVLCTIPLACYPSMQFIPPLPPSMLRVCESGNVSKYYKVYLHVENIPKCHKIPALATFSSTTTVANSVATDNISAAIGGGIFSNANDSPYRGNGMDARIAADGRSRASTLGGSVPRDDSSLTGFSVYNHVISYPNRIIESLVVHPDVILPQVQAQAQTQTQTQAQTQTQSNAQTVQGGGKHNQRKKLTFGVLQGEICDREDYNADSGGSIVSAATRSTVADSNPVISVGNNNHHHNNNNGSYKRLFEVSTSDVFLKHNTPFDIEHVMSSVHKAATHGALHGHKSHVHIHSEQNAGKLHFHGHGVNGQHSSKQQPVVVMAPVSGKLSGQWARQQQAANGGVGDRNNDGDSEWFATIAHSNKTSNATNRDKVEYISSGNDNLDFPGSRQSTKSVVRQQQQQQHEEEEVEDFAGIGTETGGVVVGWDDSEDGKEKPAPCVFKGKFSTKLSQRGEGNNSMHRNDGSGVDSVGTGNNNTTSDEYYRSAADENADHEFAGVHESVSHINITSGNVHRPNTTGSSGSLQRMNLSMNLNGSPKKRLSYGGGGGGGGSSGTGGSNRVVLPTISGSHPTLAIALSSKQHHPTGGHHTSGDTHSHQHQHHAHHQGAPSVHHNPIISPLKMKAYHLASTGSVKRSSGRGGGLRSSGGGASGGTGDSVRGTWGLSGKFGGSGRSSINKADTADGCVDSAAANAGVDSAAGLGASIGDRPSNGVYGPIFRAPVPPDGGDGGGEVTESVLIASEAAIEHQQQFPPLISMHPKTGAEAETNSAIVDPSATAGTVAVVEGENKAGRSFSSKMLSVVSSIVPSSIPSRVGSKAVSVAGTGTHTPINPLLPLPPAAAAVAEKAPMNDMPVEQEQHAGSDLAGLEQLLLVAAMGEEEHQDQDQRQSALPSAVPSAVPSAIHSTVSSAVPSRVASKVSSLAGSVVHTGIHTPIRGGTELEPIVEPAESEHMYEFPADVAIAAEFPGAFAYPGAYNDMTWALATSGGFGSDTGTGAGAVTNNATIGAAVLTPQSNNKYYDDMSNNNLNNWEVHINQEPWDQTAPGTANNDLDHVHVGVRNNNNDDDDGSLLSIDTYAQEDNTSMLVVLLDATTSSEVVAHDAMFHNIRKHYPTCKLLNFTFYDFNRAPYSRSCGMAIKAGYYRLYTEACIEASAPWYYVQDPPGTVEYSRNPMGCGSKGPVRLHVDDGRGFSGFGTPTHQHIRKPVVDRTLPITSGGISTLLLCSGADFSQNYSGLIEGALETTFKCIDVIKQQVMAPPDPRNFIKIKKNHLRTKYR